MSLQTSIYEQKMLKREKKTVGHMIQLYCEKQKHYKNGEFCTDCKQLKEYIFMHLEKCPFKEKKTACGRCELQCYPPNERKKITEVMMFAGRWMLVYHPILALHHLWDARIAPTQLSRKQITTDNTASN